MLKAHRFHVKFTVHTIMSEGGDVTMEEDYTLSYRTEEWEPESPNNLKFSKTHIQGATGIIAKDLGVHRSQIRTCKNFILVQALSLIVTFQPFQ